MQVGALHTVDSNLFFVLIVSIATFQVQCSYRLSVGAQRINEINEEVDKETVVAESHEIQSDLDKEN